MPSTESLADYLIFGETSDHRRNFCPRTDSEEGLGAMACCGAYSSLSSWRYRRTMSGLLVKQSLRCGTTKQSVVVFEPCPSGYDGFFIQHTMRNIGTIIAGCGRSLNPHNRPHVILLDRATCTELRWIEPSKPAHPRRPFGYCASLNGLQDGVRRIAEVGPL
jgi:hypothetical protein